MPNQEIHHMHKIHFILCFSELKTKNKKKEWSREGFSWEVLSLLGVLLHNYSNWLCIFYDCFHGNPGCNSCLQVGSIFGTRKVSGWLLNCFFCIVIVQGNCKRAAADFELDRGEIDIGKKGRKQRNTENREECWSWKSKLFALQSFMLWHGFTP